MVGRADPAGSVSHPFWYPTLGLLKLNAHAATRWRATRGAGWLTLWALTRLPAKGAYYAYRWMRT